MARFTVHETINRCYVVEAESFEDALRIAEDIPTDQADYTESIGFTYVLNNDTGTDLVL